MFRRWRVRHSYPKPVVDLVMRLMPIHGAAALSRSLDIPMSVIYRWREKNRDRAARTGSSAADAQPLATLVAQCEELGFRVGARARATSGRRGVSADSRQREPALQASSGNNLHDVAADAATAPPRMGGDDAEGLGNRPFPDRPETLSAVVPRTSPARSDDTVGQRYVFDADRERLVRGVRARMEGVRDAIDTRYFIDVDCNTLAQMAEMSLHHFIRVFRDMFGQSPHQYLTRVRVEAAKRLLASSLEPIEVIAVGVGFRSGASLNRAFKRIEGSSASKYCQTMKKRSVDARARASIAAGAPDDARQTIG